MSSMHSETCTRATPLQKPEWLVKSVQGFSMLPQHCGMMMACFFAAAIVVNLIRDALPQRYALFVPVPMAMAIPFYIGANVAIDICIGAVVKAYWHWTSPGTAELKVSRSRRKFLLQRSSLVLWCPSVSGKELNSSVRCPVAHEVCGGLSLYRPTGKYPLKRDLCMMEPTQGGCYRTGVHSIMRLQGLA